MTLTKMHVQEINHTGKYMFLDGLPKVFKMSQLININKCTLFQQIFP